MLLTAPLCAAALYVQVSSAKEKKGPRAKERKEAVKLVPSFKVRHTHCCLLFRSRVGHTAMLSVSLSLS